MSRSKKIAIGTRGSPLAMAQAHEVRGKLMSTHGFSHDEVEVRVISVIGDQVQDRQLAEIGGKGLFTAEIEGQLLDGRIDIAVHSSKDMPTSLPDDLELIAFLEREDPRDAFIGRAAPSLSDMPEGAVIGTSSLRRQALVCRARPDLQVIGFRGNVQTRLRKLEEGVADATLLAYAGLRRLGLTDVVTDLIDLNVFPPAPGQGAICIEGRLGDERIERLVEPLNHQATSIALSCERAFLGTLDGSCRTPIAGYARVEGEDISFSGLILQPDGTQSHEINLNGRVSNAADLGKQAGETLRKQAGDVFFEDWLVSENCD